jgi:hypothetical protein
MTITYNIIDVESLTDDHTQTYAQIMLDTQLATIFTISNVNMRRTLQQYINELAGYKNRATFVVEARDGDNCIGFRYTITGAKCMAARVYNDDTDLPAEFKSKMQPLISWLDSEGLDFSKCIHSHGALHLEYHNQGIMTEIRAMDINHARDLGMNWICAWGTVFIKSRYDYAMKFYANIGLQPVISNIEFPVFENTENSDVYKPFYVRF